MREEGKTIGEWHKMHSPQYRVYQRDWTPTGETSDVPQYPGQVPIGGWQDEGDMIAAGPRHYTAFGLAWRIALAVVIVYVLLTAALVLIPHA